MHLIMLGLQQREAPDALAAVTLPEEKVPLALRNLKDAPGLKEAVLLSTCHRFELYGVVDRLEDAMALKERLGMEHPWGLYEGEGVVRHLFRVAAGLESEVLGETEILGQVRRAYLMAQDEGAVGKVLHALFHQALRAAKEAHSRTGLGKGTWSWGSLVAEEMGRRLGPLQGKTIAIWGSGQLASQSARHLVAQGAFLLIANRTFEKARSLAEEVGGLALPWEERLRTLEEGAALLAATSAPQPVVTLEELRSLKKPLLVLDLALPPDLPLGAEALSHLEILRLGQLESILKEGRRQREGAAREAEAYLEERVQEFQAWVRSLAAVPLIRSLREKAEAIRQKEVAWALGKLGPLSPRQEAILHQMTRRIVNKLLNDPTVRLKEMAGDGHEERYLEMLEVLFDLSAEEETR
ncbi:MAG: glutamyl-tRNA reductase [Clostridiales bacterium]|nr:glutamyl-tRNA reductase [Clostridiales bacterium]